MRRGRGVRRFAGRAAFELVTVALSPLVLVAGEGVRRYALDRLRRGHRSRSWFPMLVVRDPLWIALTAPARWVYSQLGAPHWRRRRPPPAEAGVREPRRPRPGPPGAALMLAEPRAPRLKARLLGLVWRRSDR